MVINTIYHNTWKVKIKNKNRCRCSNDKVLAENLIIYEPHQHELITKFPPNGKAVVLGASEISKYTNLLYFVSAAAIVRCQIDIILSTSNSD
jgi:hypothetical protein